MGKERRDVYPHSAACLVQLSSLPASLAFLTLLSSRSPCSPNDIVLERDFPLGVLDASNLLGSQQPPRPS